MPPSMAEKQPTSLGSRCMVTRFYLAGKRQELFLARRCYTQSALELVDFGSKDKDSMRGSSIGICLQNILRVFIELR